MCLYPIHSRTVWVYQFTRKQLLMLSQFSGEFVSFLSLLFCFYYIFVLTISAERRFTLALY